MQSPFDPGYYQSEELRSFGFKSVGENVQIARNCTIIGLHNIEICDNVRIDVFCSIIVKAGFLKIGSFVHIGAFCHLLGRGGITLDDFAGLSQRVSIYSANDDFSGAAMTNPMVPEELTNVMVAPVCLGRHALIGSGAVILPGCKVGTGAAVGAMSLVTRSVPDWKISVGNPARVVRPRSQRLVTLEAGLLERAGAA